MRRICKQELLEMAKARGKGEWVDGFAKMMESYVQEYPKDVIIRNALADGGVDADCIDGLLEVSAVGGYPLLDLGMGEFPANVYTNDVYSMWLVGNGDVIEFYNKLLEQCGELHDVGKIGENGEGFYTRDNDKVFVGGEEYHLYNNAFTEIFRHSFGIEEVYLAFLLCDEDLETFYEFVGYGTEPAPKPEPEPSDLPPEKQTLVNAVTNLGRPLNALFEMLDTKEPINKAELKKYLAQVDMKYKSLTNAFEDIVYV